MTPLYAHSLPDKPQADWQPLAEHLAATAKRAAEFAAPFASINGVRKERSWQHAEA